MATKPNQDAPAEMPKDISDIVGNMYLAHEVIINDSFELKSFAKDTMESNIQNTIRRAFWDVVREQLGKEPPDYTSAFQLLQEMKQIIQDLLSANHEQIKKEVEENLDLEFIKQEVENHCFDLYKTTDFIISILLKICAPARDEEIKAIQNQDETVNILRSIMEALDHMKLDMANVQLNSIKPMLIQEAVAYERAKFQEYVTVNPDGLKLTTLWLSKAHDHLKAMLQENINRHKESSTDSSNSSQATVGVSPQVVLTDAYLLLLNFDPDRIYPETLLMDEVRLKQISYAIDIMSVCLTVMTMAWSTVAAHLTSDKEFNTTLKDEIFVLLNGVPHEKRQDAISTSIYTQVISETLKMLERRGFPPCSEEEQTNFKRCLSSLTEDGNTVRSIIVKRLRDFTLLTMASDQRPPVPQPWHLFEDKVTVGINLFARVVQHNKRVFESTYVDIIKNIMTGSS